MLIEQAIFTSAQTDRLAGYQIVAHSPGVADKDLRELAVWGPSHDSLLETGVDASSINFHPLPSGAFCVSKTSPAGHEYSARAGQKVYTQCLVVRADVLARFGNNPFALLTAAFAQGSLCVYDEVPRRLEPFRLAGRASAVDHTLLVQLQADPGANWLGALVETALSAPTLGLVAGTRCTRLIAGLLNCLPAECRTGFSFSSGLKHSPRRPFRILRVSDDAIEQRRLVRQHGITLFDVSRPPAKHSGGDGWGRFVWSAFSAGQTEFLAAQLSAPRPNLTPCDLPALGKQLLAALNALPAKADGPLPRPPAAVKAIGGADSHLDSAGPRDCLHESASTADDQRRADAPHLRLLRAAEALAAGQAEPDQPLDPAQVLSIHCPEALEKLELLDDAVFEAVAGKPGALEQCRILWPEVQAQLGARVVEESREQYIRHALRVWRDCVQGDRIRNPATAVAAVEVIGLLFGE